MGGKYREKEHERISTDFDYFKIFVRFYKNLNLVEEQSEQ